MERITMATLTKPRTSGRRSHLKLVSSNDDAAAMTVAPTGKICDLDDPNPGPRDASALVARFARVLPADVEIDGIFSLGER
jgi:hypothetical protein